MQGAHVARWTPGGQRPVLFLSSKSLFTAWKGDPRRSTGYLSVVRPARRGQAWPSSWLCAHHGVGARRNQAGQRFPVNEGLLSVVMNLQLHLQMGADSYTKSQGELAIAESTSGIIRHKGQGDLLTNFAAGGVRQTSVSGPEGTLYIDKTDGFKRKELGSEASRRSCTCLFSFGYSSQGRALIASTV